MIKELYFKYKEIINYLIFGFLTTIVSVITYVLFANLLFTEKTDITVQISNVLSWIIAVLFAFITNKLFVFESKSKDKKLVSKEITNFFFFRIVSLGIEMVIMYVFVDLLSINDLITKVIAQVIVILSNYIFSKVFVFKKNN